MTSTVDRFGRSRAAMKDIAEHARGAVCMDDFLESYDEFTGFTQTLAEPQLTGDIADDAALLNAIGATSEMGEALDVVKKMYFHDRTRAGLHKEERMTKLKGELGDHVWYFTNLLKSMGFDLREIMQYNMDALTNRPE